MRRGSHWTTEGALGAKRGRLAVMPLVHVVVGVHIVIFANHCVLHTTTVFHEQQAEGTSTCSITTPSSMRIVFVRLSVTTSVANVLRPPSAVIVFRSTALLPAIYTNDEGINGEQRWRTQPVEHILGRSVAIEMFLVPPGTQLHCAPGARDQ